MADQREGGTKEESDIRTMKSDITEFVRGEKIALLSRTAAEEAKDAAMPRAFPWVIASVVLGTLLILTGGAYFFFREQPPPTLVEDPSPPPVIFFESVTDITVPPGGAELKQALQNAAAAPQNAQTLRRIVLRVQESEVQSRLLSVRDLVQFLNIPATSAIIDTAESPQFFLWRDGFRSHFGVIIPASTPERTLQSFALGEQSMQRDYEAFFLNDILPLVLEPFKDASYRNINIRFLNLDPTQDRGIGYLYFPARGFIVVTTSEEALRIITDRLYENR